MPRLQVSGSSMVSPLRDEGELKRVLSDLGVDLSPAAVHELHVKLAVIIGQWMAARLMPKTTPCPETKGKCHEYSNESDNA